MHLKQELDRIHILLLSDQNMIKILSILEELSFDIENKYDIAQEILTERDDGMIHILSEEEKMKFYLFICF